MNMRSRIKAGYESIRLSFSEKSGFERSLMLLSFPLTMYALYLLAGILGHTVMDSGIPNEYRECANVFMTREIMEGRNPYALSSLDGTLPPMIYLYGPLYSLVTALFGKIFGLFRLTPDLVSLHYGVTFICIIGAAVLSFIIVWKRTKRPELSLTAFIFLIFCSWRYNYVNAVPDSMGLFIMILILFILTEKGVKCREILMAVLTVLIFFTKQYYLLIAGTVTAYLFLAEGIRNTVKYLVSLLVSAVLAVLVLTLSCPLFTTFTIYLAKGPGKGISSTVKRGSVKMSGMEYNFSQVMSLGGIFFFVFLVVAVAAIYLIVRFIKEFRLSPAGNKDLREKIAQAGKKAGIDQKDLLMFIHMAVSGICLTYLGQNDGAWLSYYLELFMPALIMEALFFLDLLFRYAGEKEEHLIHAAVGGLYIAFLVFTIYKSQVRLPMSPVSVSDREEWREVIETLDSCPGDKYLYPHLAYYGIENDIYVYNTGQPFVLSEKFYKSYHKHPEMMKRYPYAEQLFLSHFDYREKIRDKVRAGDYSVVSYVEGLDQVFDRDDLSLAYTHKGTYALRTGRQVWDTEIWVKK